MLAELISMRYVGLPTIPISDQNQVTPSAAQTSTTATPASKPITAQVASTSTSPASVSTEAATASQTSVATADKATSTATINNTTETPVVKPVSANSAAAISTTLSSQATSSATTRSTNQSNQVSEPSNQLSNGADSTASAATSASEAATSTAISDGSVTKNQLSQPEVTQQSENVSQTVKADVQQATTNLAATPAAVQTGNWGTAPYQYDDSTDTLTFTGGGTLAPAQYIGPDGQNPTLPGIPFPNVKHIIFSGPVNAPENASYLFVNLKYLEDIQGMNNLNLSNTTEVAQMFRFDTSLKSLDLSSWDTSNITDYSTIFGGCSSLESVNLSGWDTSKGQYVGGMFQNCTSLTKVDISMFDTRNAITTQNIFLNTPKLWSIKLGSNTVLTPNSKLVNPTTNQEIPGVNDHTVAGPSWQFVGSGTETNPKGTWIGATNIIDHQPHPGELVWAQTIKTTVTYVDNSNNNVQVGELNQLDWNYPGVDITEQVKNGYPKNGYKLADPNATYANGQNTTVGTDGITHLTVGLVHDVLPITPEQPVTPGQPIYPDQPDGPKWPDGAAVDNLKTENTVTVHYQYPDGRQAAPDATKQVQFTRNATVDAVTGQVTYGEWTPVDSATVTIDSPQINGYTPDQSQVSTTVTAGQDSDQTVTYQANDVKATIKVIDDTTGTVIDTQTVNGKTDGQLTNPVDLQALKNKGYIIGSNNVPTTFGPDADQNYEIHVTQGTSEITPENPGVPGQPIDPNNPDGPKWPDGTSADSLKTENTVTVHYQYPDGRQAAADATKQVQFTRKATVNHVTGEVTYGEWTPVDSSTVTIDSPSIDGYTPDQEQVSSTVTAGQNQEHTVTYQANDVQATIKVIDDTTGTTIDAQTINGKTGEQLSNPINLQELRNKGYVINSNNVPDQFSNEPNQSYEIHVTQGTSQITPENPGVPGQPIDPNNPDGPKWPDGTSADQLKTENSLTVHYRYADGREAAPDATKHVQFTRNATVNHVTGEVTYGDWIPVDSATATLNSPNIPGYTPDRNQVSATITAGEDQEQTVTYQGVDVQASIKVIDDSTGNVIDTQTINGKNGDPLTNPIDIQALKNKGYVIGSNNVPTTFGPDANQSYEIHVTPATSEISPENPGTPGQPIDPNNPDGPKWPDGTSADNLKTENTVTVHYQYPDGRKAAPDATKQVRFTRTATVNHVTGEVTYGDWIPVDSATVTIDSPNIPGYTPDQSQVSTTITAGKDREQTVTYNANDVQATIKVIDDTTGTTIDTQSLSGKTDGQLNNPINLQNLKNKGYVINSNNVPTKFGPEANQIYEIHVTHGSATVDPENPGTPGQPIDPSNPDGPKWPDGTAIGDLQTESTITVHYRYPDGRPAAPDATRIVKFTRTGTIDLVTGKVTYTDWTAVGNAQVTIDSPAISGYTADRNQVTVTATVGQNSTQTVTYTQNPLIVQPIDETGKPVGPAFPTDPQNPQPQEIPGYKFNRFQTKDGKTYAVYTKTENPVVPNDQITVHPIDEQGQPLGPSYPTDVNHPQAPTIPGYQFTRFETKAGKTNAVYTKLATPQPTETTPVSPEKAQPRPRQHQAQLPQTGQSQNQILGLIGMILTSLAGLLGLGKLKQRK